jgi:hypothetical protein
MQIDNLFRQLKDIQYQAAKLLKAPSINQEQINHFANYVNELKVNLIGLNFNEDILVYVNDIESIDTGFEPKHHLGIHWLNVFSFGVYKRKRSIKKRNLYFKNCAEKLVTQFAHIEYLIKEL